MSRDDNDDGDDDGSQKKTADRLDSNIGICRQSQQLFETHLPALDLSFSARAAAASIMASAVRNTIMDGTILAYIASVILTASARCTLAWHIIEYKINGESEPTASE